MATCFYFGDLLFKAQQKDTNSELKLSNWQMFSFRWKNIIERFRRLFRRIYNFWKVYNNIGYVCIYLYIQLLIFYLIQFWILLISELHQSTLH